jgi:hypothetical protein
MSRGQSILFPSVDTTDSTRWRRLTVVALVLFLSSSVLLATLLSTRARTAPRIVAGSAQAAPVRADPVALADDVSKSAPGNEIAAARPRVYSPVDVSTLAAARAYGDDPAPKPAGITANAGEAVAKDARAEGSTVTSTNSAATPAASPPSRPARAAPLQRGPAPPPMKPANDRTRLAAPSERASERRTDARPVVASLPTAVEPSRVGAVADPVTRVRDADSPSAELDAAWDRREQWMRERLRQR